MQLPLPLLLIFLAQQCVRASPPTKRSHSTHDYYVLEHNPSSGATLDECTGELGVELVEQVGELRNVWLVRSTKLMSTFSPKKVTGSDRVLGRFEDLLALSEHPTSLYPRTGARARAHRISSSIRHLSPQIPRQRIKRDSSFLERAPQLNSQPNTTSEAVAEQFGFVDPLFTKQWHIVNDEYPEHMMNVTGVWEMGLTGEGVITTLVDDGLDYRSRDLAANFVRYKLRDSLLKLTPQQDAENSYDFNDHTDLPTPTLVDDHHGTRCAGQIAAVKNDVCGVGLAYQSKVAGVRILSGPITDVDEAAALNYGFQNVSIYSCSWGPPDDGRSMEAPGYLIEKAVVNGIQNGRTGKGSIFVFASGNGASSGDQCNFDGYTNSIYSVTVSAVDFKGLHPYYSEPCAANMVVAYSSGGGRRIVSPRPHTHGIN
jgi:kexin